VQYLRTFINVLSFIGSFAVTLHGSQVAVPNFLFTVSCSPFTVHRSPFPVPGSRFPHDDFYLLKALVVAQ
jgi:hypothetical protein